MPTHGLKRIPGNWKWKGKPREIRKIQSERYLNFFSQVMSGAALTMEGVCQVYQIIQHLEREHNLGAEGLFRRHGNLKKQSALKERLNKVRMS